MSKERKINVRLSDEQYEQVVNDADLCNMSMSSYIRQRLMESDSADALKMKQEVFARLSVLSNAVNKVYEIAGNDYPEICEALEEGVMNICGILN
ncbi:MAG: hypothetical protein J1F11_00570 [Oscillospiraceae bacterium]|nr:hypothetical protein [Oscillospiraceae bacterium]